MADKNKLNFLDDGEEEKVASKVGSKNESDDSDDGDFDPPTEDDETNPLTKGELSRILLC